LLETFKSRQQKDRIDLVELEGIQARSSTIDSLTKDMCQAGFRLRQDTLENCWALDLPGTWGDLNADFSKEHRRKTKKRRNVWQNPVRRFKRFPITALSASTLSLRNIHDRQLTCDASDVTERNFPD
jgi:hypothetical protein